MTNKPESKPETFTVLGGVCLRDFEIFSIEQCDTRILIELFRYNDGGKYIVSGVWANKSFYKNPPNILEYDQILLDKMQEIHLIEKKLLISDDGDQHQEIMSSLQNRQKKSESGI